jgi:NAD(P)-dependent dehydrogenase (short-subunit alcohol dehydrogenase family)
MWSEVIKKHGGIDILVNNAAIARGKSFKEMDYS